MARTVKDVRLETRAGRERLAPRRMLYYRAIEAQKHVGYYKGAKGGIWYARICIDRRYKVHKLGIADDVRDANGIDVLSFAQAQEAARAWFDKLAREAEAKGEGAPVTVRTAVENYIKARDAREADWHGRPIKSSAAHKLHLHVLSIDDLANTEMQKLTVAKLAAWRSKLPGKAASRQRIVNDFKAALNNAASTAAMRLIIKDGLSTERIKTTAQRAAKSTDDKSKILSDDDARKLLKTIHATGDDDLYRLCLLMAATGARFAQLRLLKVEDVQRKLARIMVPASRKGRYDPDNPSPPIAVPVGQDVLDALVPATKGRKPDDYLLERWRHVQTGPMEWKRDRRGPWQSAAELARPIRAAVKAAELPASVSAYSFRHSSIVRALREGLPVRLVAQVHDTSVAMIERNYTRFMADALDDVLRKAIVPMVTEERADNVVPIGAANTA